MIVGLSQYTVLGSVWEKKVVHFPRRSAPPTGGTGVKNDFAAMSPVPGMVEVRSN